MEENTEDICKELVDRGEGWVVCGQPATHTVVYKGLPPQRYCEDHHVNARPQVG